MNTGGSETFLMKMYRKLDKSNYQFDFAEYTQDKCFFDDEILALGGHIYRLHPKADGINKNFKEIFTLVKEHSYKYVLRSGQNAASGLELLAAKKAGATTLIMKSTNSETMNGTFKEKAIHYLFKPLINKIATVKIGPSIPTLEFMFGKNFSKHGAKIFHNAVDTNVFCFDGQSRNKIRAEFNVSNDEILFGHIGRFSKQKNHKFLLKIFQMYLKSGKKAKLMLIGSGELESETRDLSKKMGLDKFVIFAGTRNDIPECLSAMDIYVFPSLYEGMPNTVIEAQAIGVPCVISDTITQEVLLSNYIKQSSLNKPNDWIININKMAGTRNGNAREDILKHGYDLNQTIVSLTKMFFSE